MNTDSVREFCLSLPHATEQMQWGADLVFKVGGKMFAVMSLELSPHVLSFKATPENFYQLQETEGIVAAPYLARAQWVALESFSVLRDSELKELIATAYRLVFEKLTKKQQTELSSPSSVPRSPSSVPRSPSSVAKTKASATKRAVKAKKKTR